MNVVKSIYPSDMAERNLAKGARLNSGLFFDKPRERDISLGDSAGQKYNSSVIVEAGSSKWDQSRNYDELWTKIESKRNALKSSWKQRFNAIQFPSDYYDFVNLLRLDITRRRVEAADFTSMFAQETTRLDATKSILLDEFKPFVGAFEQVQGRGDKVPLIQEQTGNEATVLVKIYALGDSRTLESELFDVDIYSMQKVADAYTRAFVGKRNDLTLGAMIGATFETDQSQAADTTGATYDEKLYLTINNAIEKLRGLNDPLTGLPIDASRMVLAVSYQDERKINRVINGQLDNSKGKAINLQPLSEVTELWPYRGDSITVGNRTYAYSGVPTGYAYLFVPGQYNAPAYVQVKRPLTYEVGRGDVLSLSRQEQAGYFAQAEYLTEFLGHTGGLDAGTGYVVKITLP